MKNFKATFKTDSGNDDFIVFSAIDEKDAKTKADKFLSFLKNKVYNIEEIV